MATPRPVKIIFWTFASLLVAIVAMIIFIVTFDWNLARPYVNRKVSESTGREFSIGGDLKVRFTQGSDMQPGWLPRLEISAEDVQISNPAWSTAGPQMANANRIMITLHPLPLLRKNIVVTELSLTSALLALQRRADGSNSWTMKNSGSSNWNVEIQRMALTDGNVRYLDEGIKLDLQAKISSLVDKDAIAKVGADVSTKETQIQKFALKIDLGGSYRNAPITGSGQAGALLSLKDEHTIYPVEAHANIGKNKMAIAGTLTDPKSLAGIDLQLTLGGASMADLYPLTGVLLPETPAYAIKGRLMGKKVNALWNWRYQDFSGTVGGSDVAGSLQYQQQQPRPLLSGTITSQQLRLEDLGPTIGAESKASKAAQNKVSLQPDQKVLPVAQFNTANWGALDADVKFKGKKLVRTHEIPLQDVVADIHMKDKVLSLTPLNFGMAGGDVTSNISLDGRKEKITAQIKLTARHLKVRELFPALESMKTSFGEVNSDAALTGHGNSISSMLATSNGQIGAVVTEGTVSQFMLEIAGLNLANAVFVKVFGDKQVHLNCLASDFNVKNGLAEVKNFVIDTDDAVIDISGNINLAQEQLNLDVRPKTKGVRIISLRTPLYAKGTFKHPDVGPYKGPLALKAAAAVALAAVAPFAAVLPLVNLGNTPDTNCTSALAKTTKIMRAPKTEQVAAPAKAVSAEQMKTLKDEKKK
ncbi:AsmA family protein [Undibacterium sp. CY18W]|uniref:AsmA family protein n=2 Tax=Undibacterium hunanense TaxID=2762292 RepID=A0ABR6ZPX7_9BURK|nr:AsmA family protein [Undibacterium hunanense]